MTRIATIALIALAASTSLVAQVTFDSSILQLAVSQPDIQIGTNTEILGDLAAQSGENQTWDFSAVVFEADTTKPPTWLEMPAGTPYDGQALVAGATHAGNGGDLQEDAWLFTKLTDSELIIVGLWGASDMDGDSVVDTIAVFTDPRRVVLKAPLKYEDAWSQVVDNVFLTNGETTLTSRDSVMNTVDAYGSMTINGVSGDCLRLKTEVVSSEATSGIRIGESVVFQWFCKSGEDFFVVDAGFLRDGDSWIEMSSFDLTGTSNEVQTTTSDVALAPVFPNPGSGSISIPVSLTESGRVRVTVTDLLGREVAEIVDSRLVSGDHTLQWKPNDVPSGVYVIVLESNAQRMTRLHTVLR